MAIEEKTTLADRASTGLVNGAFGGFVTATTFAGLNGLTQLLTKAPSFKKVLPTSGQWKITAGIAALSAVFGFIKANKSDEKKAEAALENALTAYNNSTDPQSKKQREKELDATISSVLDGNIPAEQSKKFQNMVAASRQPKSQQIG